VVRDHEAQHRVAEELESLVRGVLRVLRTPRAVRERLVEELRVAEGPSQPLLAPGSILGRNATAAVLAAEPPSRATT
jgi:hypothetical protein